MGMADRIDRLRRWVDATKPGATTELDREIIEELFDGIAAGESATRRLETSEREARDARLTLWAVVRACGGEVRVPSEILLEKPADPTIARELDQFTSCYIYKAR